MNVQLDPWRTQGASIMKYLDEYRDSAAARKLTGAIAQTMTRPWTIMEVCGGQTHTIVKYGVDRILPQGLELVHGPGCPVCVTSLEMIDRAHAIAVPLRRHLSAPSATCCAFPGQHGDLLPLEIAGQRCAHRLFAAGCREPGRGQSRSAGGLLRHRLRNHGAGQRHGGLASASRRAV